MADSRVGFLWIYALIVFFATGVIELVVMPAVQYQFVPALETSANVTLSPADAAAFAVKVSTTVNNMHLGIYVLMFVLLVYMLLSIFKREENEMPQP